MIDISPEEEELITVKLRQSVIYEVIDHKIRNWLTSEFQLADLWGNKFEMPLMLSQSEVKKRSELVVLNYKLAVVEDRISKLILKLINTPTEHDEALIIKDLLIQKHFKIQLTKEINEI